VKANGGSGVSNGSGYYQITAAPSPTQTVTTTGSGWAADPQTVTVNAGYTAQLNTFLVPSGSATGSMTVSSPAEGSNVISPVQIKAAGLSSDGPITTMEVYTVAGTLLYKTSGSGVSTSLSLPLGGQELIIQGSDAHGNWFKTPVNFVVQQNGSATLTSPLNGGFVASPVTITGEADPAKGITSMQVYEDNNLVYNTSGSQVNTSIAMTAGTHNILLQGKDAAGNVFKSNAEITVSSTVSAPEVTAASPTQGAAVSSPVSVIASAAVPGKTIAAMQIYEDNKLVYQVAGSELNTSLSMSAGSHALAIKAWDTSDGNYITLRTITVTN